MAVIASTIANAHSKRKFTPKDFMPQWDRKPQQSEMEQMQIAMTLAARGGGTFTHGRTPS